MIKKCIQLYNTEKHYYSVNAYYEYKPTAKKVYFPFWTYWVQGFRFITLL